MDAQEERDLARRLADDSDVFDFEKALELVRLRPEEAERLIRNREEWAKLLAELARVNQRLHQAALEFR